MMHRLLAMVAATLALSALPGRAYAESKPLWEFGMGVGGVSFPAYPGSDEQRNYVVPVPYFVYRGKIIKADRNGVQARLFDTDRIESYVSLSASPPVNSTSNGARSGMPDLKPMVEFGPALDVHLWQSAARRMQLDFRVPLRTAYTVQTHPHQVGWVLAPVLNLDIGNVGGLPDWNLGMQTGPVFADRQYNQTFYGVDSAYATATRPAYTAHGGYSGSQFTIGLSKRFPQFWFGAFARYNNLKGAVFADSPLMRRNQNLSFGFGIAWMLGQSSRMVDSHE
jgi:outer membrane scaffolding protein for murein synthesis (MipA/OmpV family)